MQFYSVSPMSRSPFPRYDLLLVESCTVRGSCFIDSDYPLLGRACIMFTYLPLLYFSSAPSHLSPFPSDTAYLITHHIRLAQLLFRHPTIVCMFIAPPGMVNFSLPSVVDKADATPGGRPRRPTGYPRDDIPSPPESPTERRRSSIFKTMYVGSRQSLNVSLLTSLP